MRTNITTTDIETILMCKVVSGNLQAVEAAFVKYNFAPDDSYFDYELLKAAIRQRDKHMILFLLNYGCRVRNPNKGFEDTPLHLAMLINNKIGRIKSDRLNQMNWLDLEEIVRHLLDRGASIYDKNSNGDTPLYAAFRAAAEKNEEISWVGFKLARFNIKPTNTDDLLHFHIACAMDAHHTVKHYLKYGFNPNEPMCLNFKAYDGLNPIQYSIKCNNLDLFKILTNYADLSVKYGDGLTYLHMIYRSRYPKNCKAWIKEAFCGKGLTGNFSNFEDNYGLSHFHLSCMLDHPFIVQAFIRKGVDVNNSVSLAAQINPGFTPLHFAVESNNEQVFEVLLKAGADPNKADKWGVTPLHLACKKSTNSIIKMLLLKYKANPIIPDSEGFTPLHELIYNGKRDGISIFDTAMSEAQWGSSNYEDNNGLSFFHIACATKDAVNRVKMFLDSGVNIDSRVHSGKYSGFTALHFAVMYNQKAIVEFLLKSNANVNVKIDASELSPLHLACEYIHYMNLDKNELMCQCRSIQLNIIKLLLFHGAQVDAKDSSGMTPLLHTCMVIKNGRHLSHSSREESYELIVRKETVIRLQETIKILISNKASAKSQTSKQSSILHIISEYENLNMSEEFIDFLINSGADVNAVDDAGLTPLHVAVQCFNEHMLKSLLKHNANPNIKCKRSKTPLHIAAEQLVNNVARDGVSTIKKLLDHGADINVNDGHTVYLLDFEHFQRTTTKYGKLLRTIFVQVQKLLALKLHVSQILHLRCIQFHEVFMKKYSNRDSFKKLNDTFDNCLDELNKMKKINLDNYTTLYDILLKDPHELVTHVKNSCFRKIVEGSNDFRRYGYLLKLQFKRGLERIRVLKSAKTALTNVLNINLPVSCSDSILKNLKNEDIVNLKEAAPVKSDLKRKLDDNYSNPIESSSNLKKKKNK